MSAEVPPTTLLGRRVESPTHYDPGWLQALGRTRLSQRTELSMHGIDRWTVHDFSYLDALGRPQFIPLQLELDAASASFIESKSMKLYLASLAMERFADLEEVLRLIAADLQRCCGSPWKVQSVVLPLESFSDRRRWADIAAADTSILNYRIEDVALPKVAIDHNAPQRWRWGAFRSLCPVTAQPDYAELLIEGEGPLLDAPSLLRYLSAFRNEPIFHEAVIERLFGDLAQAANWQWLSVVGLFQRRGGIDISPFRSSRTDFQRDLRNGRQ